jgi:DNA-binding transcriptional ArsR family regulator
MVEQLEPELDAVFQALASPARRRMLNTLAQGEQSVGALAAPFDMSLAAASKHVKTLERAGLVIRTIHGRTHVVRLNPKPLAEANAWFKYYEQFWNERLDALERVLLEADRNKE